MLVEPSRQSHGARNFLTPQLEYPSLQTVQSEKKVTRTYLHLQNLIVWHRVTGREPGAQNTNGELMSFFGIERITDDRGHHILVERCSTIEVIDSEETC